MAEFDSVGSAFNHRVIDRAAVYPDESTQYFLPRRRNSRTWRDSSVRPCHFLSNLSPVLHCLFFSYEISRDGREAKDSYRYICQFLLPARDRWNSIRCHESGTIYLALPLSSRGVDAISRVYTREFDVAPRRRQRVRRPAFSAEIPS